MTGGNAWVLTDGRAGTRNQALGLAEAVGLPFVEKLVRSAAPWRWLPPMLWPTGLLGVGPGGDPLEPPWPDLVISSGGRAAGPALAIRRRGGGRTFCVHVTNPRVDPARFDLVTTARHDRLSGPNVIVTLGALNRVTPARLDEAAKQFAPTFEHLPRPLVAVLVGGSNRVYRMSPAIMRKMAADLASIAVETGAGLLVTTSRRTGAKNEAALRKALDGLPAWFWDGTGDNPYFGFLALADAIVVTADSVSMVSEACAAGKPVHVVGLEGGGRSKFALFHRVLEDEGYTRPFSGALETGQTRPLDETARVAAEVRRHMGID